MTASTAAETPFPNSLFKGCLAKYIIAAKGTAALDVAVSPATDMLRTRGKVIPVFFEIVEAP